MMEELIVLNLVKAVVTSPRLAILGAVIICHAARSESSISSSMIVFSEKLSFMIKRILFAPSDEKGHPVASSKTEWERQTIGDIFDRTILCPNH